MDWHTQIWVDPLVALGLLGLAGGALRWLWRQVIRPLSLMLQDWHGSPPRPGVPARPGVMVRLERLEAELTPNGGKSVKDRVEKIAKTVGAEEE